MTENTLGKMNATKWYEKKKKKQVSFSLYKLKQIDDKIQ